MSCYHVQHGRHTQTRSRVKRPVRASHVCASISMRACARVRVRVRVCVCVCACARVRTRGDANADQMRVLCARVLACARVRTRECKCGSKLQIKNVSQIWVFGREHMDMANAATHIDVQQFLTLLRDPEAMRDRAQQRSYLPEFCHLYLGQDTFAPRLSVLNRESNRFQHSCASVSVYVRAKASTAISSLRQARVLSQQHFAQAEDHDTEPRCSIRNIPRCAYRPPSTVINETSSCSTDTSVLIDLRDLCMRSLSPASPKK